MTTKKPKKEATQSNAGRPTKFKKEYCEMLIEHMKKGLSFESFAGVLEVTKSTLYEWVKDSDEFSNAKEIGSECSRLYWESLGQENMHDISEAGCINKKFNTTMWVFNMKNRFRKEWTEQKEESDNNKITVIEIHKPQ